jgi:hypothetical protein
MGPLAQLQDQIEELGSDEHEVVVEYESSSKSPAVQSVSNPKSPNEGSKTYDEIVDDIKIKEFNLERSFHLEEKLLQIEEPEHGSKTTRSIKNQLNNVMIKDIIEMKKAYQI